MKKTFSVCYAYYGCVDVEAEDFGEATDMVADMDDDELTKNAQFEFTSVIEYDENGKSVHERIM